MGQAIIGAITGAFGLIVNLAELMLDGFETLIWVPATTVEGVTVAGHLTSVSEYGLAFLGIACVFAVIRKVFNMLSGNTGI